MRYLKIPMVLGDVWRSEFKMKDSNLGMFFYDFSLQLLEYLIKLNLFTKFFMFMNYAYKKIMKIDSILDWPFERIGEDYEIRTWKKNQALKEQFLSMLQDSLADAKPKKAQ